MVEPRKIVVREVKTPLIGDDDVLIKVKYCGICGTDIHIYNGVYSLDKLPLIPGHEFVGTIAAAGKNVRGWQIGETVTADINLSCGSCIYCLQNKPLLCSSMSQIGIHQNGAFAEYVAAPARALFRLNPETPKEKLTLIEPVSCCVRTFRSSGISFAKSVVVVGGGSMGILLVQMAKLVGAAPVIMAARRRQTLDTALASGADHAVLLGEGDIDEVKKLTGGMGSDYVIEAVGRRDTYEKSCEMLGPGGRLVVFGIMEAGEKTPFEFYRTVLLEQSMTGSCAGAGSDFYEAARLVEYNRFDLSRYSETILPLENIAEGFDRAVNDKSALKVIIDLEKIKGAAE